MATEIISKRCSNCKRIKSLLDFHKDRNKKYGHSNQCKICKKKKDKKYSKTENGKASHRKALVRYRQTKKGKIVSRLVHKNYRIRHPERIKAYKKQYTNQYSERLKARDAVNHAITAGKLPRANTLLCHYCPKPAQQYHHWHGYEPEHWLDIVPACRKCHQNIHKKSA